MADLTKKDLKEIFIKSLEPFANAIQKDIQKLDDKVEKLDDKVKKLDVKVERLDAKVEVLSEKVDKIETDVKEMKENSGALFTKLDRYISFYEALSHDFMAMNVHINRLDDRVAKLEKKQGIK